jgi:hypothetical protein
MYSTAEKIPVVFIDMMHWNVSIGPEKLPIFGRFLTLFPLKCPARREKNTSNMAATIGDVMDDVTCKSSIGFSQNKTLSVRCPAYF